MTSLLSCSKNVRAVDLKTRVIKNEIGKRKMLVAEVYVDCKDAMGANTINSMCELLGPEIERKTNGKVILKILSNYATERVATSKATFKKEELGGTEIVDRILSAFAFAFSDPHRAVTHNKGIMIANEELVELFKNRVQSPYAVNSISLAIAISVISNSDRVEKSISLIRHDIRRI